MTQTNEKKDIKVVVVDIDGTLLNSKMELSERNEKAIKAAAAQGVQIVLATGKTRNSATALYEKLGIKTAGIFLQGLSLYDSEGKVTHQLTLDPNIARQVITYAEDRGFEIFAYSGLRILTRSSAQRYNESLIKYHESCEVIGALHNIVGELPINKLMVVGKDGRSITALRWQLNLQLGKSARIMQAGIPEMLEVLPPGASKGAALKMLTKDLRVPADSVMAIGDAENDIEMIQFAGVGVAMGQAAQPVKDAANYVAPSNDEDGVADAIEKFVLPPPPAAASTSEAKPKPKEKSDTSGDKS
jgi:Cof subfamily protein (haloacid dehalogenase superfamily)